MRHYRTLSSDSFDALVTILLGLVSQLGFISGVSISVAHKVSSCPISMN